MGKRGLSKDLNGNHYHQPNLPLLQSPNTFLEESLLYEFLVRFSPPFTSLPGDLCSPDLLLGSLYYVVFYVERKLTIIEHG
jgi:hypothetical protein